MSGDPQRCQWGGTAGEGHRLTGQSPGGTRPEAPSASLHELSPPARQLVHVRAEAQSARLLDWQVTLLPGASVSPHVRLMALTSAQHSALCWLLLTPRHGPYFQAGCKGLGQLWSQEESGRS